MKKILFALLLLLSGITVYAQSIPYTNCEKCWVPDSLGNHRVVLQFTGKGKIAKVIIPWRRRDTDPQNKRIIIQDAQTMQKVNNVKTGVINRESGELYFEPTSGSGTYYVYYLPSKNEGRSNYPKGVYLKPEMTASADWLSALSSATDIPLASVKEFQSIDAFNTFYPMEVIATKDETDQLLSKHSSDDFLVFPEDRIYSIRMADDLPQRWIERGPQSSYTAQASRGENFAYQLGIYALQNLDSVTVAFSDLTSAKVSAPIICFVSIPMVWDIMPYLLLKS